MSEERDLLGMLQSETIRSGCYSCNHPIAKQLTDSLISKLKQEQKEGRMLGFTKVALYRVVKKECEKQKHPFLRAEENFRRHVIKDTAWND